MEEVEMNEESALSQQQGGDHYRRFKIQPAEFLARNRIEFLEGCVIKRMCRHEAKDGVKDLLKAKHEIDLILHTKYNRKPDGEPIESIT